MKIRLVLNSIVVSLITLFVSFLFLIGYVSGHLNGNINNAILSAERFGVPTELASHGIQEFYQGKKETGWDGQFYYYISNDLLSGDTDTLKHIDNPIYRYQRPGVGIFVKAISVGLGESWVSPTTYYLSYLLLVCLATFVLAKFLGELSSKRFMPYLALFWSLSISVQLTLLNYLPDAGSDCFLIFAIVALYYRRWLVYAISMSFCLLSRESYVLLPVFVLIFVFFHYYKNRVKISTTHISCLFIPLVVYFLWHHHISSLPGNLSAIGNNLLYPIPLASSLHYLFINMSEMSFSYHSKIEVLFTVNFLLIVFIAIVATTKLIKSEKFSIEIMGVMFGVLLLTTLYLFFGNTVTFDYTGYMKVLGAPVITILISLAVINGRSNKWFLIGYFIVITGVGFIPLRDRFISAPPYSVTTISRMDTNVSSCLGDGNYKYKLLIVDDDTSLSNQPSSVFSHWLKNIGTIIFPGHNYERLLVKVINTGDQPWQVGAESSIHPINLSYHYIDNQLVVHDGIRTPLYRSVMPGDSTTQDILVQKFNDGSKLILSPVQEGCKWFYLDK